MRRLGELRAGADAGAGAGAGAGVGLRELCITTNGVALHRRLDAMVEAGLTAVNLSLDTLDPARFARVTRRPGSYLESVVRSLEQALALAASAARRGGPGGVGGGLRKVKLNCVVVRGVNDDELEAFADLTRDRDLEVRFIEYMPFDGNGWDRGGLLPYADMLARLRARYPGLERVAPAGTGEGETSKTYRVPGFEGRVGFITSMTYNFCGSCNRLRVTADGNLKVCLFGNAEVSLRDILRRSSGGEPISEDAFEDMRRAARARRDAGPQQHPPPLIPNEHELLEVIGVAVRGKKAKHAGLGQLEHMKNRPMILIGG